MTSLHAPLPPSGSHIWVVCSANPLMTAALVKTLPEGDRKPANDGTASHWAMAEIAADRVVAEGQITDDGWVLSAEMIEGAQMLVDDVVAVVPHIQRQFWHVEERVSMAARIHRDNWGTPDCWVFDANTWTIYIWDYKFGYELVEVFENWQLMDYLAGILEALGINAQQEQHVKVVFTIVQPRAFHPQGPIRRWRVEAASNLRGYHNRLEMAAEEAMSGFAQARPNKGCYRCDARHVCQALQKDAYRAAEMAFQDVPMLLSPEALATELNVLVAAQERLKARVDGLMTLGDAEARAGKLVPGWELATTPGREKWHDTKLAASMGRMYRIDIVKEETLITPRQARLAGMPEEVVAQLSARSPASREFKPVEESRGRRIFGKF